MLKGKTGEASSDRLMRSRNIGIRLTNQNKEQCVNRIQHDSTKRVGRLVGDPKVMMSKTMIMMVVRTTIKFSVVIMLLNIMLPVMDHNLCIHWRWTYGS